MSTKCVWLLTSNVDSLKTPRLMCVLQGEKDWQKYETARRLKKCVEKIRSQYREDWKSKEMRIRQRAVALYFIDKVQTHSRTLTRVLHPAGDPHIGAEMGGV